MQIHVYWPGGTVIRSIGLSLQKYESGDLPQLWHIILSEDKGGSPHAVRLVVWSKSKAIPKSQLLAQIPEEHAKVSL